MRRGPRGGPGQASARLARAEALLASVDGAAREPLDLLAAVLRHQTDRAPDGEAIGAGSPVLEAMAAGGRQSLPRVQQGRHPLPHQLVDELAPTFDALVPSVPQPLADAASHLRAVPPAEAEELSEAWLDDATLVDSRLAFWLQVAAGPLLEAAAQSTEVPADWQGSACPVCGALPQASVIAEESGEFMAGSPRSLVCGRCATWWPFPRATCVGCHQEDPRLLDGFLEDDRRWARVDTCSACRTYAKTFDLRQPGARDVVPLVDDVATLTLDIWAQQHGYTRPTPSLAGV